MRKITYIFLTLAAALCLTSCEGCVKNVTKKATEIGLGAVEGVSEALAERGGEVSGKTADAIGSMVQRASKSVKEHLSEYAGYVPGKNDSTGVTNFKYFHKNEISKHYEPIKFTLDNTKCLSIELLGRLKTKPVVDAFMRLPDAGSYDVSFKFMSEQHVILMEKNVNAVKESAGSPDYVVASFALDESELSKLDSTAMVAVTVNELILKCD